MSHQELMDTEVAVKPQAIDHAKKTVTVAADDGVTFAGVHYAQGKSIQCTAAQEEILKQHNVIKG